ncbi:DUF5110 domain-containing protein [candidate division KSB1 bacterium]|nr:DUF5110 domain-containing protein [candidate division KSB1 bacterium]
MKHTASLLFTLLFMMIIMQSVKVAADNPEANPAAMILSGNYRFTVLTSSVVRIEWSEDGLFEDRASLVFVNRNLLIPPFNQSTENGWNVISTEKLKLCFKPGTGKFDESNLYIEFDCNGTKKIWKPGLKNKGNLKGTARTLDGFNGNVNSWSHQEIDLGEGLISRDGWVLIDDSERPLFDDSDWPWVQARPNKKLQDYYFFGYGHDYKRALYEFMQIAGKIALPPKFAFGSWWSRYWEYSDWELRELVKEFEANDVPLDVLVVDMDWHITSKPEWYDKGKMIKDQADQGIGWTGFTWNRNYFPDPEKFLQWTAVRDLNVCMNLHPASGIQPHEEQYPEMARAMGIDPNTKQYVPFDIVNKNFAENFLKIVLHPMEEDGVDFWWLDWQQWSTTSIKGVNPTFYLNYVFFSDMERRNHKRPLIFHRYGGLGNHRYQIGFSGDSHVSWKSLDFQPYFTANAANVGFGFWSHDIGGHYHGGSDPELYTRWVQFGIFSPILRTHCTKSNEIERRIWAYPYDNFKIMRYAFQLRYALIPYIYTMARKAHDSGISICRPMYYDYPDDAAAYNYPNQYMFGDDLIVSPITRPMGNDSLFVTQKIWLPKGKWYDWNTGSLMEGNITIKRTYALDEIPIFVRAGAIVPMQPKMSCIDEKPVDPLILTIFPGSDGLVSIYDDQGNTNDYKDGKFTLTDVGSKIHDHTLTVTIHPVKGEYPGMIEARTYEIQCPLSFPPESVVLNGEKLNYVGPDSDEAGWTYCGDQLMTVIRTKKFDVHSVVNLDIEFPDEDGGLLNDNIRKFKNLIKFTKALAVNNWDKSKYSNDLVVNAAQTGLMISMNPTQIQEELNRFTSEWYMITDMIEQATTEKKELRAYYELLVAGE